MKLTEKQLRSLIAKETRTALKESTTKRRSLKSLLPLVFEGDDKKDVDLDIAKGPSDAVKYLNGPGADKRVRALLSAGKEDGSEDDEKAQVKEGSATIGDLIPTQVEIELTKSIGYPLAKFDSLKKMISGGVQLIGPKGNDKIVTSGNLIVDGHHRWSSLFSVAGPGGQIASIDVTLPEKDAASVLAIVQTAIAATLDGPVPKAKAGGMNILGKNKDEIAKLIRAAYESGQGEAGPVLTDDYVKSCLDDAEVSKHFGLKGTSSQESSEKSGDEQKAESRFLRGNLLSEKSTKYGKKMDRRIEAARTAIINKVAENLSQMKQPAEGAPPRVDMPQLDKAGGGIQGVMDKLSSGDVNYKEPFAKESAAAEGEVLVERWQKLAGIIK